MSKATSEQNTTSNVNEREQKLRVMGAASGDLRVDLCVFEVCRPFYHNVAGATFVCMSPKKFVQRNRQLNFFPQKSLLVA